MAAGARPLGSWRRAAHGPGADAARPSIVHWRRDSVFPDHRRPDQFPPVVRQRYRGRAARPVNVFGRPRRCGKARRFVFTAGLPCGRMVRHGAILPRQAWAYFSWLHAPRSRVAVKSAPSAFFRSFPMRYLLDLRPGLPSLLTHIPGGSAPDGGLYPPGSLPQVSPAELGRLAESVLRRSGFRDSQEVHRRHSRRRPQRLSSPRPIPRKSIAIPVMEEILRKSRR